MKTRILVITIIAVMVAAGFAIGAKNDAEKAPATKTTEFKTEMDKVSYIVGTNVGRSFKQGGLDDLAFDSFIKGIKDVFANKDLAISEPEMQETMKAFQKKMSAKMQAEKAAVGGKNTKEGAAFLAENSKKEGVVTLPSGLQYKILKKGTGAKLKATDNFKALYKGTLIDGTVFDSTAKRNNKPLEMPVSKVIPGWIEALQIMPIGSTWILYIPGKLAYGSRGSGALIGPNATLIFEMELLGGGEKK